MRQNFKDINIFSGFGRQNGQDWQKENGITANWKTPEQIDIQPVYIWKEWSIWTLQPAYLRSCAARTA